MDQFCTYAEGMKIWRLGMNTLRKHAKEAGAVIKVGRRVLINVEKMNEYLKNKK